MSTLWKLLGVILALVNLMGRPFLCEAVPVRPADTVSEAVCTAETEATRPNRFAVAGLPDVEDRSDLEGSLFAKVLDEHDAFLPQMADWRKRLAARAAALAQLVKIFPGTEHLSEERIRETFGSRSGVSAGAPRGDVFRPWAGRWSGQWGDGSSQYHIWDPSHRHDGRQVQRVAQSETAFPEAARLEAMVRRNEADLAVNVFSERFGITGWVSKRQHGPLAIPCIGYLLEPAVLLWICQTSRRLQRRMGQKALTKDEWFAYLESVEASTGLPTYHIYGHAVEITHRGLRYGALTSLHTGHYQAR